MKQIKIAFNLEPLYIPTEKILVTKFLAEHNRYARKYKQIKASIIEVGIIEPLSIFEIPGEKQMYSLLDGHMRFEILKELGFTEVPCLMSTDDESYTHNKQTNRLATVQEHLMIRKAIKRGVNEERLAKTLNIDVKYIKSKVNLLNGICPEVVELLKDREISQQVFFILKKMKPLRQLECVEIMLSVNNLTVNYAKALLVATNPNFLVFPSKKSNKNSASSDAIKKIENDIAHLHLQYKSIEQDHAQTTLNLVLAIGYLRKILSNKNIKNYLVKYHTDLIESFESLIQLDSFNSK
ncbi:ParB N-terminal domain-containing protein [Acinetobacter ursingii]|uniref:ParB N-terminal domain-containing protein n=3 Tax=Acinetobacter ursingii TaxID=108980 RepID=A0AA46NQL6_9GAMM|nr:plasmid partitioning protein RepB C-terminal domain-containing protein [Acinetobacter ursingii]UYF76517.1 ParB N-terminal domain-containing protein [Acinetobacter ursingii]